MPVYTPNDLLVGINRYIMECKFTSKEGLYQTGKELIDTLWNVNPAIGEMVAVFGMRINRYIMECKSIKIPFAVLYES